MSLVGVEKEFGWFRSLGGVAVLEVLGDTWLGGWRGELAVVVATLVSFSRICACVGV